MKNNLKKKIKSNGAIKGQPSKKKVIPAIFLLAIGVVLMPTGFLLSDVIQDEIDKGIAEQVSVPSKHSSDFDEWLSNDYDDAPEIYKTFYVWNLTNPNEYLEGNKAVYDEIGPFVFREYNYKKGVKFSDNNEKVTFSKYTYYVQTGGARVSDVNITNINPGYLGAREKAGGTDLDLIKLMFPMVLSDVRETFIEEYLATLPITIATDPLVPLAMEGTLIVPGYIPPGINEIPQNELPEPFNDTSTYNFSTALPSVSVFYEKWANDYYPNTGHSGILLGVLPVWLDNTSITGESAQEHNNNKVNQDGSASGVGVDIDGRAPYNFLGSETDLNISTSKVVEYPYQGTIVFHVNEGGSNITQEQCQALWNESDPNSLTGFDYEKNTIWYDALDGNIKSRQFLNNTFGLTDAQLDLILDWINVSINTWSKNVGEWTLNDWNSGFIVTRTAEEWLFTANDTAIYNHQIYYNQEIDLAEVAIFKPEVQNFKINTGKSDIDEVGQIIEYNGQDTIYIWAEPEEIEGTDGLQFAPDISEDDTLKTFQPDLMRVVELEYHKEAEIYDIDLLRFKLATDTFSVNPNYYMATDGLINLAPLEEYQSVPVRVSKPHLLGTGISILTSVNGMKPNGDYHDTYIDVEPLTGIVMNARNRIQVNFEVGPSEIYQPNITHAVIPITWYEQSGEIPEELAEEFKDLVYGALELKENVPLYSFGIGAALCIPGAALVTSDIIKRRKIKESRITRKDKALKRKARIKKEKLGLKDIKLEDNKLSSDNST